MFKEGDIAISGTLRPYLIIETKNKNRFIYNILATKYLNTLYNFSQKGMGENKSYTKDGLYSEGSSKKYMYNLMSKVDKLSLAILTKDYCSFLTDLFNVVNKSRDKYTIIVNTKSMSSKKYLAEKTIKTQDLEFYNKIFDLDQFVLKAASSYREHNCLRIINDKQKKLFQNINKED